MTYLTSVRGITKVSGSKGHETNDCSIRAVCNATGLPYDQVHELMKNHGRKDKGGMYMEDFNRALETLGIKMIAAHGTTKIANEAVRTYNVKRYEGISLGRFLKRNCRAVYILMINGHYTCVRYGNLFDAGYQKSGSSVGCVWKVEIR